MESIAPGAFHGAGWPKTLCPGNTDLKDAREDSVGNPNVSCGGKRKRKQTVWCGNRHRKIYAKCEHLVFGVNQQRIDDALANGNSAEKALASLLNAYETKKSFLNFISIVHLNRAITNTYGQQPFEMAASSAITYFQGLTSAPTDSAFRGLLEQWGFIMTP